MERKRNRQGAKRQGFTYVDVIASIAILLLCLMMVLFGINTTYKNLHMIRANQALENMIRDEILLLNQTGVYTNKKIDHFQITYEHVASEIYRHKIIETVKLCVEDEDTGAKREYTTAFQK